jgi:hypothetical protein
MGRHNRELAFALLLRNSSGGGKASAPAGNQHVDRLFDKARSILSEFSTLARATLLHDKEAWLE